LIGRPISAPSTLVFEHLRQITGALAELRTLWCQQTWLNPDQKWLENSNFTENLGIDGKSSINGGLDSWEKHL